MPSVDLLVEGEGQGVCRCSDLVLRLHVGHLFCICLIDGHHPVSHADASLGRLTAWGQLDRGEHGDRNRREVNEDMRGGSRGAVMSSFRGNSLLTG